MKDLVLAEAHRLHKLGAAILWLHPKSKRPIEDKWTTGPRADWGYLQETYMKGLNVGVRLGTPSKIAKRYLAVIDVDVKSKDPKHLAEVNAKLKELIGEVDLPRVDSGRGNGSKHLYLLTKEPLKPFLISRSKDLVKVHMGGGKPSKREVEQLTPEELKAGIRLRWAWEIGIMGDGQQVVLPPSIHPTSGKEYRWANPFDKRALTDIDLKPLTKPDDTASSLPPKELVGVGLVEPRVGFIAVNVGVAELPISKRMKEMIIDGTGVDDRSAMLLPAAAALLKAGLGRDEILSVLTDPTLFLGACSYDHAKTKDRVRAARWVWSYSLKKVMAEQSAEAMFREPIEAPKPISFEDMLKAEENEVRHWADDMDQTEKGKYRSTLKNIDLVLSKNVEQPLFVKDLFANRISYGIGSPWGGRCGEYLEDIDLTLARLWLANNEYGLEAPVNLMHDATAIIAHRHRVHPVKDYLEKLKWDGKPRINTWLKDYCAAKAEEPYLSEVSRKFLCAMVKRVFEPGCQMDYILVLEGNQGAFKSSAARALCGDKWFMDNLPDLKDKDAMLNLQGKWLIELGELANVKRADYSQVKAYLSRRMDTVRPHYGRIQADVPRQSVFIGTVNEGQFLKDPTGNRRFWPVKVGICLAKKLERDRDQLFAEAMHFYLVEHEELFLSPEANGIAIEAQESKRVVDDSSEMKETLIEFLQSEKSSEFNFGDFKSRDLFEMGGPWVRWEKHKYGPQLAAEVLNGVGFISKKSNGRRFWKKPSPRLWGVLTLKEERDFY